MTDNRRRVWTVEEVPLPQGGFGQRQTEGAFDENTDKTWYWVRPDERLNDAQRKEWDRVIGLLQKVKGEDLRHVICFAGLLDHCLKNGMTGDYSDPTDKKSDK